LGYFGVKGILGGNPFGIVYLVFGAIGLLMTFQDIRGASKHHDKKAYLRKHLQRLGGGFIASMTAFLVVNVRELPEWFPVWTLWLLPTLLISPLISFWSKVYKKPTI
jgi:cell division protein FtsW (lipid II flippase)